MAGLNNVEGRVAVVTGGASGIGRGIAEELISRGAKVVIADIEADKLAATAAEIGAVGIQTDVTKIESVQALADETMKRFGRVDIVCNNAGVGPFAKIKDMTLADWKFVLDVNLWGVIHGTHVFLPHLIANKDGGHFVNTASHAGFFSAPTIAPYAVSKFGVVALSEALSMEMAMDGIPVGVSILTPGTVRTEIYNSQRNRPAELAGGALQDVSKMEDIGADYDGVRNWLEPREVGRIVADSIQDGRLYVITHPEMFPPIGSRHKAIAAAHGV